MRLKPTYIELETKDCLMLTCIFMATGHFFTTLICLALMLISARGDQKEAAAKESDDAPK